VKGVALAFIAWGVVCVIAYLLWRYAKEHQ
jgi:hypothetical protein